MSAKATHSSKTTNTAGFPPAPPEAHLRANVKGDTREIVLNGSRILMSHDGRQWWNIKVTAQ